MRILYNDDMTAKRRGKKPLNGAIVTAVIDKVAQGKKDVEILAQLPTVSQSSLTKIKKTKAEIIEAKKEAYIKSIDSFAGDKRQAVRLAEMVDAEIPVFNFQGKKVGSKPDHESRLKAIKYIDQLKGRINPIKSLTQKNTFISQQLDKYTS